MINKEWIGVDLDGTLAHWDGWVHPCNIGAPIPKMVERVKKWIADGIEVRVFTARVSPPIFEAGVSVDDVKHAIGIWTLQNIGTRLEATCQKDYLMRELWDDRAVSVRPNTGESVFETLAAANSTIGHYNAEIEELRVDNVKLLEELRKLSASLVKHQHEAFDAKAESERLRQELEVANACIRSKVEFAIKEQQA